MSEEIDLNTITKFIEHFKKGGRYARDTPCLIDGEIALLVFLASLYGEMAPVHWFGEETLGTPAIYDWDKFKRHHEYEELGWGNYTVEKFIDFIYLAT